MSLLFRSVIVFSLLFLNTGVLAFDQFETFKENGKFGLRNADTQEIVLKAEYEAIGWSDKSFKIFNNTIGIRQNEKWALASVDGSRITPHLYTVLYPFTDNLFIVGVRSSFNILNKLGVLSTKGKVIVGLQYDQLKPLKDQLIAGSLTQGQYQFGLFAKNGKPLISQNHASIKPIEDDILSVKNNDGLSAIFNTKGDKLSAFEFEDIRPHNNKYLLVTYYNHQALIDKTGKAVTPPIYKEIKLDDQGKTVALPFKKWTFFGENSHEQKLLYFDEIIPVNKYTLAIQTNDNVGLITREQSYKAYLPKLKLLGAYHGLLLVANDQYQGVIDTKGNFILPLNYDSIDIKERMIFGQIKRGDKQDWQVFSHRGVPQNNQRYESYQQVSDYMIYASRNGKSGILDGRGNEASPFFYDAISPLVGNKMVVKYQSNQGVINDRGNWVITPYKDSLALFEHHALYKQGSEWGILDFAERVLYKGQKPLHSISDKLLTTQDEDGYQLINNRGALLQQKHYDSIYSIHNDLVALKKSDRTWLFRPSNFKLLETPKNTELLGQYSEDMIAAKIDGQWGFISEQAHLMIANRYDGIHEFSEGLVAVKLIGKWGIINHKEDIIVQPVYDRIMPFHGGLAVVEQNGLMGLIDRTGKLILDLEYSNIERFEKHIILSLNGLLGLADSRGNIVRSPQYNSIQPIDKKQFIVTSRNMSGVISLSGVDIVPVAFEQIKIFGDLFLAAEPSQWTQISIK